MKLVFFGTPHFAVYTLKALFDSNHQILAVVTQPDRPSGRGYKLTPSPVKEFALLNNIPVLQPEKVRSKSFIVSLATFQADAFIVAAYGQILPLSILNMPPYGCLNVHASLLPRHRGASPINQAIILGDQKTGITIMQMDKGLDTGPILYLKEIPISPTDTAASLHDKLASLGGPALVEALSLIESNSVTPHPQDNSLATYAPLLKKDDGLLDFSLPSYSVLNRIRGLYPRPGAFTFLDKKPLKILRASPFPQKTPDLPPGSVVTPNNDILVATPDSFIRLDLVQPAGGRSMPAHDFLLGHRITSSTILGI